MCNESEHDHGQGCGRHNGGCDCGCCGNCCESDGHFERRYETKEEQISALETYLGELKLELKAVEEHIADLRK